PGLPSPDRHAAGRRQARPQAATAAAVARGPGLRLGAGAAALTLAGDHPGLGGQVYRARQWPGRVPLGGGADHLVAALVRPAPPPAGPRHGTPTGVPPARLRPDLSEVLIPVTTSLLPNALRQRGRGSNHAIVDLGVAGSSPVIHPRPKPFSRTLFSIPSGGRKCGTKP